MEALGGTCFDEIVRECLPIQRAVRELIFRERVSETLRGNSKWRERRWKHSWQVWEQVKVRKEREKRKWGVRAYNCFEWICCKDAQRKVGGGCYKVTVGHI